ncbi:MAG: hypothetical protein NE330_14930 [Lentisphaeraceae bacterium]|nr:hypothetical protein [Lentisphaeraceae bacterium]
MKFDLILRYLFIFSLVFLASCSTDDEELNLDDDKHADYYEMDSFNFRNFDYLEYNRTGFEQALRTDKVLEEHKPEVIIEEKGGLITLKFANHSNTYKHYFSWFEITDSHKNEVYVDNESGEDDEKTFQIEVYPENPFRTRIRVRCFCQVHGEFIHYIDLPSYDEKTIIDVD